MAYKILADFQVADSGDAAVGIGGLELMLEQSYRDRLANHTPHTSIPSKGELLNSSKDACVTQTL